MTLLAFKCLYPNGMHLTRGNHEAKSMNTIYGFNGEASSFLTGGRGWGAAWLGRLPCLHCFSCCMLVLSFICLYGGSHVTNQHQP